MENHSVLEKRQRKQAGVNSEASLVKPAGHFWPQNGVNLQLLLSPLPSMIDSFLAIMREGAVNKK